MKIVVYRLSIGYYILPGQPGRLRYATQACMGENIKTSQ